MHYNNPKGRIILIFLAITACFILVSNVGAVLAAVPLIPGSDDMVIAPADYEIVPIDDGTEIIENTPLLSLLLWRTEVLSFIDSLWRETPYRDIVRNAVIPFTAAVLGFSIFIVFTRRKSPEKNPESTPAKILTYIRQHKFCSQKQIVEGVGSSRGSVAYQLHRLENEQKVFATEVNGRTYYSAHPIDQESLEPVIHSILENETTGSIFKTLYLHPNLTRHEIAGIIGKSPDTVYFHLKKFDGRLLTEVKEGGNSYYSLSPDANDAYFRMERGEVTGGERIVMET
jgi:predicted transcriptional regulator